VDTCRLGARRGTSARYAALLLAAALLAGCAGASGAGQPAAAPPGHASHPAPWKKGRRKGPATTPLAAVARYLARRSGQVTVALHDALTGHTWLLNPRAVQDTASIVKVQIMGTALQQAEAAGEQLPGAEEALMPSMIENSDNQSATSLLQAVGGPGALALFDRSAGLDRTVPSTLALIPGTPWPGWGLTTTTALDQVRHRVDLRPWPRLCARRSHPRQSHRGVRGRNHPGCGENRVRQARRHSSPDRAVTICRTRR
jgi:hypothetical protein